MYELSFLLVGAVTALVAVAAYSIWRNARDEFDRLRMCTSRILMRERVYNDVRTFGEAAYYYPAYVLDGTEWRPALFTKEGLDEAVARAAKPNNVIDMPPRAD